MITVKQIINPHGDRAIQLSIEVSDLRITYQHAGKQDVHFLRGEYESMLKSLNNNTPYEYGCVTLEYADKDAYLAITCPYGHYVVRLYDAQAIALTLQMIIAVLHLVPEQGSYFTVQSSHSDRILVG